MTLGPREGNTSTGARQSAPSHHVVFEMCATYALSNASIAPAKVLPSLGSFTSIPKQRVFFRQRGRKNLGGMKADGPCNEEATNELTAVRGA